MHYNNGLIKQNTHFFAFVLLSAIVVVVVVAVVVAPTKSTSRGVNTTHARFRHQNMLLSSSDIKIHVSESE